MKLKRLATWIAPLAIAAGSLVAMPAQSASAADGCTGSPTAWNNWDDSAGRLAARTYYYEESSGTICVNLVSQGIYYGSAKYMSIKLCNPAAAACVTDSGTYKYYAGPVRKKWDVCLYVVQTMHTASGTTIVNKHTYAPPCD